MQANDITGFVCETKGMNTWIIVIVVPRCRTKRRQAFPVLTFAPICVILNR